MNFSPNTLAAAAVALTAAAPGFAQSELDPQLVPMQDELNALVLKLEDIDDLEQREGALVKIYEYFENKLDEADRINMVMLSLLYLPPSSPTFRAKKRSDVAIILRPPVTALPDEEKEVDDELPFDAPFTVLSDEQMAAFLRAAEVFGGLEMLISGGEGSTWKCITTLGGERCYKRPRN